MTGEKKQLPVYFISHGGPTFMYRDGPGGQSGAWDTVAKIGKEIQTELKPRGIVVISAHWQTSGGGVEVTATNDGQENSLIYDFYGFPPHMYKETFHSVGNTQLSQTVAQELSDHGIKTRLVDRGIDHGVWVPFKVCFPQGLGHQIPLVQLSMMESDDPRHHFDLGLALANLRTQGILVVCSGMSVHNLQLWHSGKQYPWAKQFDDDLAHAVTKYTGESRFNHLAHLLTLPIARLAHPTFEHLFPIYVASGCAAGNEAERIYTAVTGSLAWGEYIFKS